MTQIKAFLSICNTMVKRGIDDEGDGGYSNRRQNFYSPQLAGFAGATPTGTTARAAAGVRRAGTIVRSPLESRRDRKEASDGDMRASDVSPFVHPCSVSDIQSNRPLHMC